jgi:hypothetical protein
MKDYIISEKNAYNDIIKLEKMGSGIFSFLSRINNILDFILCLSSHKLYNLLPDERCYIPPFVNQELVYSYFIDKDKLIQEELKYYKYKEDYPVRIPDLKTNSNHKPNSFRKCLLNLFQKINHQLHKVCTIKYYKLFYNNFIDISIDNFNSLFPICNSDIINLSANENYNNYLNISFKTFELFNYNIEIYPDKSQINLLHNLLKSSDECTHYSLQQNLDIWNATCDSKIKEDEQTMFGGNNNNFQKYIKYKQKYIQLKKIINESKK